MGQNYKQLTLDERYQIQALSQCDYSARHIAKKLGRSNKTISNELKRFLPHSYDAKSAHYQAINKRFGSVKFSKLTPTLIKLIDSMLKLDFSPEQIAGRLRLEKNDRAISTQTMYRLIALKGWRHRLPRKGKKYKQLKGAEAGAKLIPNRVDIDERPEEVDLKQDIGHWEGDTVHGKDGYFVTLAERKTKLFLFMRVQRKTKKEVSKAIIKLLKPHKKRCNTITFDNGGEFAGHASIAKRLKCKIYFAKPYHSWQRGLNENSNGLLRRYFPKGSRIGYVSQQELENVMLLINFRPRKSLGFLSPIEILTGKRVSLMSRI